MRTPALAAANDQRPRRRRRGIAVLSVLAATVGGAVWATNYTLWINGRNNLGRVGAHLDFSYWGPDTVAAGVNKRAINWDGFNRISTTNGGIRDALDCYCTGPNWCYIGAYSAGDNQIGYALSLFGGTQREVRNATPNSAGVCGATGGTQTGWNIKWVSVAGGSAGGTELANIGSWAVSDPLTADLKTSTARAMYNHNETRAKWLYMYAGAKGTGYSALLPGQDDEVVAYHSSGGVSGSGGASFCNPRDWFCNDLTLGTANNEGGRAKWSYHSVQFRDDGQAFSHSLNGNWQGIAGRMRVDMELLAR